MNRTILTLLALLAATPALAGGPPVTLYDEAGRALGTALNPLFMSGGTGGTGGATAANQASILTQLQALNAVEAPYQGVVALTPGTPGTAGRALRVIVPSGTSGTVTLTYADGSTDTVPVNGGLNYIAGAITTASIPTTGGATGATFAIMK